MTDGYRATATMDIGMSFIGTTGSGHRLVMDAAAEAGGVERGPRPMELVLLGLAGCTAMDVASILQKMRQQVTGYEVRVHGERAEEHPRVYTAITVEHVIRGRDLTETLVKRAIELSATRYCPVSAMLGAASQVRHISLIEQEAPVLVG